MQGQASPGVQKAEDFADYIESIARGAPPVPGIEGIAGSGAHDGPALAGNERPPEEANSPGVRLGRNENHSAIAFAANRASNHFDFSVGIYNSRRASADLVPTP